MAAAALEEASMVALAGHVNPDADALEVLHRTAGDHDQEVSLASQVSPVMRVSCHGTGFTVQPLSAALSRGMSRATSGKLAHISSRHSASRMDMGDPWPEPPLQAVWPRASWGPPV